MDKSLYLKLAFIIVLVIVLVMTVVCAFLLRGVEDFFLEQFYDQMQITFRNSEFVSGLQSAVDDGSARQMREIMGAYSGVLGIDTETRNYYILDGRTGEVLISSDVGEYNLATTPNLLAAFNGKTGSGGSISSGYMDIAVPMTGDSGSYIVYIKDSGQVSQKLSGQLFMIIIEALAFGFVIAVVISFVLSKAMLKPITGMTKAAKEMAKGDFSRKIEVQSKDEIGVMADTFNNMANQLETTLQGIRRSEELRREFVANVSHELRTPITSIRSYAETLADGDDMPGTMRENFLQVIVNESDRMTKIVQDLLELSKMDAGGVEFTMEEFSVKKAVENVCNTVALQAKDRGHTMTLDIPEDLPLIYGDRARLEQVFMNIITNAIKYTPDGGTIEVKGHLEEKNVKISVKDNGIGIPEEDMSRVFDRFYRVDKARSRESGGTGLGLSIASEIVERHGGKIELNSIGGVGTEVTVILPVDGGRHEEKEN